MEDSRLWYFSPLNNQNSNFFSLLSTTFLGLLGNLGLILKENNQRGISVLTNQRSSAVDVYPPRSTVFPLGQSCFSMFFVLEIFLYISPPLSLSLLSASPTFQFCREHPRSLTKSLYLSPYLFANRKDLCPFISLLFPSPFCFAGETTVIWRKDEIFHSDFAKHEELSHVRAL